MTDWASQSRWSAVWSAMNWVMYDKAMSRLRVSLIVLAVIQLTLIARLALEGLSVGVGVAELLVVPLLVGSLLLWRQGRRLGARRPKS